MTEQEQKAFDQMREALMATEFHLVEVGKRGNGLHKQCEDALTAANAVSEPHARDAVTWTPETGYVFAEQPQAQGDVDNPHNVDKPNEQADYGHDNSVSFGFQTPYYCAKCNEHMGDTDLPKNVPLRKYAVCYGCQEKATHPQATEPQAQGKDHLNVASQCRATASHPISQQIEVDGGNGTLFMLLMDAAHSIEQLMATHPQATEPAWRPIESAPKDGTMVLCWVSAVQYGETDEGQQFQRDISQIDFGSWEDGLDGNGYFDPYCGQIGDQQHVTHWMPLPAAPEAHHGK